MKKWLMFLKSLLLFFFGSLLFFSSFSSAWTYTYTWSLTKSINSSTSTSNTTITAFTLPLPIITFKNSTFSNYISNLTCEISNLSAWTLNIVSLSSAYYRGDWVATTTSDWISFNWNWTYVIPFTTNKSDSFYWVYIRLTYSRPNDAGSLSFDWSCSISWPNIINQADLGPCPTCEVCQDCSSIQNAYETLSWYYSTCQSNLTTCQWSLSWYDSCQGSLGACLEDNISLQNMNDSLSEQLEVCLENESSTCVVGVDTGCVEWTILPLLSWSVGLDSFTTPIINNLTLPTNYKWKLVDWVLSISSINQNLSIDDSDYWNIKDSFVNIVLYIFGVGLMLILVYYVKFYLFNIKD